MYPVTYSRYTSALHFLDFFCMRPYLYTQYKGKTELNRNCFYIIVYLSLHLEISVNFIVLSARQYACLDVVSNAKYIL